MPGPGGTGPAGQKVAAVGFIDPRLCTQQVLVAAFPELPPEVHMAFVDPARMVLSLREASISDGDGIGFGNERTISLTDIGSVQNNDGEVIVLGRNAQQLLHMHFEALEDENIWARGLRAIGDVSMMASNQEEDEEEAPAEVREMHGLQAQSRQLQNRIGSLETMSERRDHQIQKMVKRLDGAMQMLAAVEDMCGQQRRVIEAQQLAQKALRHDLGWEEVNREDISDETATVMANLLSPSRLAHTAAELSGLTSTAAELSGSSMPISPTSAGCSSAPVSLAAQAEAEEPEPAPHSISEQLEEQLEDEGEADSDEAVRERLYALEAEKEHFETLLRESQQEHDDLLTRLSSMRSLMSAFGTLDDVEDDNGNDEDDEYGEDDEDDEDYEDEEDEDDEPA